MKTKLYSVAAYQPVNIEVEATSIREAIEKAKAFANNEFTSPDAKVVEADGCDLVVRPGKHGVAILATYEDSAQ